jgi:hypothetical protein
LERAASSAYIFFFNGLRATSSILVPLGLRGQPTYSAAATDFTIRIHLPALLFLGVIRSLRTKKRKLHEPCRAPRKAGYSSPAAGKFSRAVRDFLIFFVSIIHIFFHLMCRNCCCLATVPRWLGASSSRVWCALLLWEPSGDFQVVLLTRSPSLLQSELRCRMVGLAHHQFATRIHQGEAPRGDFPRPAGWIGEHCSWVNSCKFIHCSHLHAYLFLQFSIRLEKNITIRSEKHLHSCAATWR